MIYRILTIRLILIIHLSIAGCINELICQNAPVSTIPIIGNLSTGNISNLPISVNNFTDIGAVTLTIDYNWAVLHLTQITKNNSLGGTMNWGDADLGNGNHQITINWFGSWKTLPDGSMLFTLSFTYLSGSTTLEFYDSGPTCEYTGTGYVILNDQPTADYYINGSVCGGLGTPGTINGPATVCEGSAGVVYSISPVENATGYDWTVPPGAVITSGSGTTVITVDYTNATASGNVSVTPADLCGTGSTAQLGVTLAPLPDANAGADKSIPYGTATTLHAGNGGSGSFQYHWEPASLLVDPDQQDAQTVSLTSTTLFTLTVTNETTLCQSTDQVSVMVTGGTLGLNPVSVPDTICAGETSQLFANAGGGSGSYTYLWTSDPPGDPVWSSTEANPVVSPGATTTFLVTVDDGFTNIMGFTHVIVNQLPPKPSITVINDTLLSDAPAGNQWYQDGIAIPGATNQVFLPDEPGIYQVNVMLSGCFSDFSDAIWFGATGFPGTAKNDFVVFPNPFQDEIMVIPAETKIDLCKICIFSNLGTLISEIPINGIMERNFKIDLSLIPDGLYFLVFTYENDKFVKKVIKQSEHM
jgi:hypothetical protein